VILPVFNAAHTVEEAVRSLVAGGLSDSEILAVDDGSTDGSGEVLARLQDELPRLRLYTQLHRGIVAALTTGIEHATGEYFARMDADDVSLPKRLERQRRFLDQHREIGVVTGRVRFGGDRHDAEGYAAYVDWINTLRDPDDFAFHRFVESPVAHPAVMFRRACVDRFGGYRNGTFPEDYELWLRWMEAGVLFASIPEEVLLWNDPPARLSRTHERYSIEAFYAMKAEYLARWCALHVDSWPDVVVWGAGRITRKRVQLLEARGARVRMWVDIDAKKIGQRIGGADVVAPDHLPGPGACFILSFVANRDARAQIRTWLNRHAYIPERDYIFAA
jgi:glycosyltransferase involved in cell wall biosynthesis